VDNEKDCKALKINLVGKGQYGTWQMPAYASTACTIPSISMLLHERNSSKESGVSNSQGNEQFLGPFGADQEKAAELVAAAAAAQAAEAAANAILASAAGRSGATFHLYNTLAEQLLYY
jgi:hypothetical protein